MREGGAAPHPGVAPPAAPPPPPPLGLLIAMTALGPFTMQILIPSLPGLVGTLGTTPAAVQLTLTLYLAGVAVGQLVYGPLSDRFGRRPLLLGGFAVYAAGTLAAALAPSIGWLVVARMAQAVGSCAGLVIGRAIIRDAWPREQAASVLGTVTMVMSVAPMIAPLIGSLAEAAFGWRAGMVLCLGLALPLWLLLLARLPETLAAPAALPGLAGMLGGYAQLARLPLFRALNALTGFSTGVFFAFMAGAPFVVVQGMGETPTAYALAFMTVSVTYALGSWIAARLSVRLGIWRMLGIGCALTTAGALASLAVQALLPPDIWLFFLPMAVIAIGNGMAQPNSVAAALSVRPTMAGTASALVGFWQMALGAGLTVLVGVAEDGSGIATAAVMALSAIGTQAMLRRARRVEMGQAAGGRPAPGEG